MKLIWAGLVLAIASLCGAFDETSDAKKAVEARFALVSKAFAAKDVKLFESTFTTDFKSKAPGKPIASRAEVFKDFEAQMKVMNSVKWTQKIKSFKLEKGVAFVGFDSELKSKVDGDDGKQHDFRITSKTKNEWVKGQSGWQVRYSESLELKMWLDGEELKSGG